MIKKIKVFLRLAISFGFFSAVADRFGLWSPEVSAWGNWDNFVLSTAQLNSWWPEAFIPAIAIVATVAEIIFACCLLFGYKTELFAKLSGILLLIFALSMTSATGLKSAFDYSVFTSSAAAFALSLIKDKYFEIDCLLGKSKITP